MMENCSLTSLSKNDLTNTIRSLSFAVLELALYLDTHPTSHKALALHNKYSKRLCEAKEVYENRFGALNLFSPVENWDWVCNSWPWERGNF